VNIPPNLARNPGAAPPFGSGTFAFDASRFAKLNKKRLFKSKWLYPTGPS
jgi:hypothetical protein